MATENTVTSVPLVEEMTAPQSYYTWAPEGKSIQIRLDFDVIDKLSVEVMRGFGSVPKRGGEVGGLLLGQVDKSGPLVVHIHDFVPVPCAYRRGPSYLLTENDTLAFSDAVNKAGQGTDPELRPIGYYRSHTRDGMGLTDEDLQLFSNYFPDPTSIVLLIRPFATKVSQAGFFFEENGQIRSDNPYLTFPFRRRELGGGAPTSEPARPMIVPPPAAPEAEAPVADSAAPQESRDDADDSRGAIPIRDLKTAGPIPVAVPLPPPGSTTDQRPLFGKSEEAPFSPSFDVTASSQREIAGAAPSFGGSGNGNTFNTEASSKLKKSWVWLPLSSIFLLLGVMVGFLIAITIKRPANVIPLSAYSLSLAVQQEPDSIHVTWDRSAVPVLNSKRGVLHIQDGDFYKPVELKPADLQTGSVIIRNVHSNVNLRLEVFTGDNGSITESRTVSAK